MSDTLLLGTNSGDIYTLNILTGNLNLIYSTKLDNENINGFSIFENTIYAISSHSVYEFNLNYNLIHIISTYDKLPYYKSINVNKTQIQVVSSKYNAYTILDKNYKFKDTFSYPVYGLLGDNNNYLLINDLTTDKDFIYLNIGVNDFYKDSFCGLIKLDKNLNELERINSGYNSYRSSIINNNIFTLCNKNKIESLPPGLLVNNKLKLKFDNNFELYDFSVNEKYICIVGYFRNNKDKDKFECGGFVSVFNINYNKLNYFKIDGTGAISSCILLNNDLTDIK